MVADAQVTLSTLAEARTPRILFVLGKGGVGRSTIAAAHGLALARRGARVLVVQWAVADVLGPWFGVAAAGGEPREVAPRLSVANFALDHAMRAYFVDHLRLGFLYRHVLRARPVARMIEVAPGLSEMFFLGWLWWLVTLAEPEAGLAFDRIVVDAPATGHAASLLDVPATLAAMAPAGLLAEETARVVDLLADPARVGAIVVALPEPLVIDETLELTARLARPPLATIVNRSARGLHAPWMPELAPELARALAAIDEELRARREVEAALAARTVIAPVAEYPGRAPIDVVRAIAEVA